MNGYNRCISVPAHLHRQVRYDQLMCQQEKMIQDMEKAVYRREAIMLRLGVCVCVFMHVCYLRAELNKLIWFLCLYYMNSAN